MPFRLKLLCLAALLGAGCGTKPPEKPPPGPETCNNGKDDNGDGKIDCLDPKCFQDAACRGMSERCDNDVDDNGDALIDCADPMCAGQSCGFSCLCIGGVEVINGMGGGAGGSGGGASGGGSGGGTATGGGAGGGTGGAGGGGTATGGGGGTAAGGGGGTATGGGGGTASGGGGGAASGGGGGTASGGGGGAASGGGGGSATGGGSGGGGGAVMTETNCADNIDNDSDNATDCDDSNCVGVTCGFGCTCALNRKVEVNCSDGASNDGDALIDCADPDCVGVGGENCADGIDNDCDKAIDCGDSTCTGNAACANLVDGKPCLADTQCAGNKCFTEASTGVAQGACSNATPCTDGTTQGCNGGMCSGTTCYARCTGTGLSGSGACRAGFICFDPDTNLSNNNNICVVGCSSSTECSGTGTGYGCNPWSKRCGQLDRGLARYGATCTANSQCESGSCYTGANYPGGYCTGACRGDTLNCGSNGFCSFNSSYGDNLGTCFQSCTFYAAPPGPECLNPNMSCLRTSSGASTRACSCFLNGSFCEFNYDCCSGKCSLSTSTCIP